MQLPSAKFDLMKLALSLANAIVLSPELKYSNSNGVKIKEPHVFKTELLFSVQIARADF